MVMTHQKLNNCKKIVMETDSIQVPWGNNEKHLILTF
jgi:hypothetical protein